MNCRICGSAVRQIEQLDVCTQVSILSSRPSVLNSSIVGIYSCSVCSHVQIKDFHDDYYDDFLMATKKTEAVVEIRNNQFETLAKLSENRDSFIEIGCGTGFNLETAGTLFHYVLGVEPSKAAAEIAKKRGCRVINDYFPTKHDIGKFFDGFALIQVLEHVTDPIDLLRSTYDILSDKAIGLIEVPNGQKIFNQKLYHSIFSDHVNYFTPLSLCKLAYQSGFEIVTFNESLNGDHLDMFVRKGGKKESFNTAIQDMIGQIASIASEYKIISAWGAGAKAFGFIKRLRESLSLKYIFDSDPIKSGRYIPGALVPVVLPEKVKINENELIVIFASSYENEIIRQLREEYGFKNDILRIGNEVKLSAK